MMKWVFVLSILSTNGFGYVKSQWITWRSGDIKCGPNETSGQGSCNSGKNILCSGYAEFLDEKGNVGMQPVACSSNKSCDKVTVEECAADQTTFLPEATSEGIVPSKNAPRRRVSQ